MFAQIRRISEQFRRERSLTQHWDTVLPLLVPNPNETPMPSEIDSPRTKADISERERATAVRLTRFRGDMNEEDFTLLVKDVVRVFYKVYLDGFEQRTLSRFLPPLRLAIRTI